MKMDAPRSYENVGKPLQDYAVLQPESPQVYYSREVFTVYSSARFQFEETCCPLLYRSMFLASRGFNDERDIP
jgi:hypothetical protein